MTKMIVFHEWGEEIRNLLRLKTFPVAVKLLEEGEDIPEGAKRPMSDLGHHLALCQGFSMSRREGTLVAMLKEDMWCFMPVIGFGLAEPPEYFLEGHGFSQFTTSTMEGARNRAHEFPRLKTGKYIGVVSAPLETTNFEPDLVIIYCDPAQLRLLLMAKAWRDGRGIACTLTAGAACVWSLVPAIQSEECQVAVPCPGEQTKAMAQDDELIFTVPRGKLEDVVLGLRYLDEHGLRFPMGLTLMPEYELNEIYIKIGKMMGMEWLR